PSIVRRMITALAGGVGAARFLAGLVDAVDPKDVTAIVNTADDDIFHGLYVCPDLDSVTYRLAGVANPDTGWGIANETFTTMDALDRYGAPTWFRLGNQDLATHLYRTEQLRQGATLSEVTTAITRSWGIAPRVLPMTDARVTTRITADINGEATTFAMQEWFVRERAVPRVIDIAFDGATAATPAPGVLAAIAAASTIIICPSNPLISIGPIVAIPAIRSALVAARDRVVAISPLIAGRAVKGPADHMMAAQGYDASCVGVAEMYREFCSAFVIDQRDDSRATEVEALGYRVVVTDTLMHDVRIAAALAQSALTAIAS
ncbi:MAG: 2-phospho-L-lactate transferase, partial [Acidimicrobiia bacterium]